MGIELPPELRAIADRTGLAWPEADEDAMLAQASAWRDAQRKLSVLAADADTSAGGVLGALDGSVAASAGTLWSGFVEPDNGLLTAAVRAAGESADRLEHAANEIGAAKAEMVRQLVDAAKNTEAAETAAAAGQPWALAGIGSVVDGSAANLAAVSGGLVASVEAPGGAQIATVGPVVDPNPGAYTPSGQGGLVAAVTGLPPELASTVDPDATGVVPREVVDGTGPIMLPPPSQPRYGGFLDGRTFDDVPTPSAGIPLGQPGQTAVSSYPGEHGAFRAAPVPAPVPPVAPPVVPPVVQPVVHSVVQPPAVYPQPSPWPHAPHPVPVPPAGAQPVGAAPRQERQGVVAMFVVHMFPIGHLPVASARPERQLPGGFAPHDHPRADEVDSAEAIDRVRGGWRRLPTPPGEPPASVTEDAAAVGASDFSGETAEMLAAGVVLDRFGEPFGRMFSPDGTPFARRGLPAEAVEAGYRRYRVLRELPMWFAGGTRYRAQYSADELVSMGYLADITFGERGEQ